MAKEKQKKINAYKKSKYIAHPLVKLSREENIKRHSISNNKYYQKNKKEILKKAVNRNRERLVTDIAYKIKIRIRFRLWSALKGKSKKLSTELLTGCSFQELKVHLENQFKHGMSWENYGRKGWTIDHKIPLSSFDLSNQDELKKACHYTNLQPLWEIENIRKGNKII